MREFIDRIFQKYLTPRERRFSISTTDSKRAARR